MKYLVLIAVVLTVLWLARAPQRGVRRPGGPVGSPGVPQAMVECAACGLHLPQTEALPGPGERFYCCAEHRARGPGRA